MEYQQQMNAIAKYGMEAGQRLVRDHAELFLSLDEKSTVEAIISVVRLHAVELPTPTTEQETYDIFARILGELLEAGIVKAKDYGLSAIGQAELNTLVARLNPTPTEPVDRFHDVIQLYRGNVSEFNNRRASDADFLRRSNEANQLGLLR